MIDCRFRRCRCDNYESPSADGRGGEGFARITIGYVWDTFGDEKQVIRVLLRHNSKGPNTQ